ncbi:FAD dependent oxidoreductase superfamily [Grosmannia clavigera kw1407]|uniref:L-2-hydroxyglutarate dehydrogenase, mitochondrial n=1 Tax=Grosmannia clavigera (strain kw1407 / UAMH 11150) TaxID=655863 RepID=F0XUL3_GROCL|nr:FAD dependent oxidoreductase superfamily [Grosmannia clavigera kw1407]EFW98854.1 FAD dependent oxidoreductase superfamily [Grosmannia clavigera kw1407]
MLHGPSRVAVGTAAGRRFFSSTASCGADFTHAVIGGGVVGLAVARALAERAGSASCSSSSSSSSVLVLERHAAVGTETSSRNSEVIHAGLYYGANSLKTQLCIRGRRLLYDFCAAHGVPHRRTGKWLVAQTAAQLAALQRIDAAAREYSRHHDDATLLPLRWVSAAEAQRREPAVRADAGVLESLATGIVDSHGLMAALQGGFEQAGGTVALSSPVVRISALGHTKKDGSGGWAIHVRPVGEAEEFTVVAETLVNAAGLGSADIYNMITQGTGSPKVSTLIYPAPEPGLAGLGTHLTLDLAGRMRFGPDVEWVDHPYNLAVHGAARLPQAVPVIRAYLPDIDADALQPDYAGIRPKLAPAGHGAADFVVRAEPGYHGWVNLLGIESPGLTSSLAIGEMVEELLYS